MEKEMIWMEVMGSKRWVLDGGSACDEGDEESGMGGMRRWDADDGEIEMKGDAEKII